MRVLLKEHGLNTEPEWIEGIKEGHISGELRERAFSLIPQNSDNTIIELADLLIEAAERLDDAHEEWMERELLYGTPS